MLKWRVFLVLSLSQAIGALGWLLSIPSDPPSAIIFGFSTARVLLATIPIVIAIACVVGLAAHTLPKYRLRTDYWIKNLRESRFFRNTYIGLFAVFFLVLVGLPISGASEAIFQRLLPLLCLGMLLSLGIGILCFHQSSEPNKLGDLRSFLVFAGFVGILIGLSSWASRDLLLESRYYSGAGAPIVPYQFIVTLYISVMTIILPLKKGRLLTIVSPILLFLLATTMWSAARIPINHFTHESNLSSGDLFPYSDARTHDGNGQIMLMGHGLAGGYPFARPLYSFFLGWMHVLFGETLSAVLDAQTVFLALVPVVIYSLGARLLHPAAGLAAALLFIFRETNQALLGSEYTLSSFRLLMSETLMAGLLVAFSVSATKWLAKPESRKAALLTGALLGLATLVRTQGLLLGGVVIVFLLLRTYQMLRSFIAPSLLFLFGMLLVILPWMTRNFINSGWFSIDDRDFRNYIPQIFPSTSTANTGGNPISVETAPLSELSPSVTQETTEDSDKALVSPEVIASSEPSPSTQETPEIPQNLAIPPDRGLFLHIVSFLTNSNLSSLYQLPWKLDFNPTLKEYVANEIDSPLVHNPQLNKGQYAVLLAHLLVIAIGLTSTWNRQKFVGLLPAGIYLSYNLSSVAANYSGWRFIQPVDWVVLLYWAIGFVAIICYFLRINPWESKATHSILPRQKETPSFRLAVIMVLGLGLLMPIGETLFPKQALPDRASLLLQIEQSATNPNTREVFDLASDLETNIITGVLLYPELLITERDYMLSKVEHLWPSGQMLTFNVVSDQPRWYYAPDFEEVTLVKHYMPVIVVSCKTSISWSTPSDKQLPEAIAILVQAEEPYWLYVNQSVPETCN